MKLNLGFSPCPNDTFIFDALVNGKIDSKGLEFYISYLDVESLNDKAFNCQLDITKLSYHAYTYVSSDYELLDAGSALGFGVGPLLICKDSSLSNRLLNDDPQTIDWADIKIGIPGKYTTANFLLGLAFPNLKQKTEMLFSDIEQSLMTGQIDVGLIIHENRFTYQEKGLQKIIDLGDYWESTTGFPIPLGGIAVKRSLPKSIKKSINLLIAQSVQYGLDHPKSSLDYIRNHAQEMEEEVIYKHIALYVNEYSLDLGEKGRAAVKYLFEQARLLNLIPDINTRIFLTK